MIPVTITITILLFFSFQYFLGILIKLYGLKKKYQIKKEEFDRIKKNIVSFNYEQYDKIIHDNIYNEFQSFVNINKEENLNDELRRLAKVYKIIK